MANEYILTIKNETDDKVRAGALNGDSEGGRNAKSAAKNAKKIVGKAFAYRQIKSFTDQIATYEHSQIQLRTGSKEQHQRANFAYNVLTSVYNIGESVAMGAMAGNLPGALLGLTLGVMSSVMTYTQRATTLDTQRQLEDVSRDLSAQRVTVSGGRYMNATEF